MSQFHQLTVSAIEQETRDTRVVAFAVPPTLVDTFQYQQGQYLTLKTEINGQEIRRSYSICASLASQELKVAVKQVSDGLFSTYINNELQVGDLLEIMPPMGRFTSTLDSSHHKTYLLIAAGSGITPIISILQSILEQEPNSRVTLVYGNRATSSVIFRERLEDIKNQYLNRFNTIYVMSREKQDIDLFNGRIDGEKITALLQQWIRAEHIDECFICGPESMTKACQRSLQAHGLMNENIHIELFGRQKTVRGFNCDTDKDKPKKPQQEELGVSVSIQIDGHTQNFVMAKNHKSLLQAGLDAGADLPWACQAGVCSTCKCRVLEGQIEMDVNHALEDYEIADGYILSCQSYPLTDNIVLDYDV